MSSEENNDWDLKLPASRAISGDTNHQLQQLRQLLPDFEAVFSLLDMYPELARTKDPESDNMLPLHTAMMIGAPTTTIMILLEAYPDAMKSRDASGNTPFHTGMVPALEQIIVPTNTQMDEGKGKSPITDIVSLLNNLDFIVESFPEIVHLKDGTGNLPLNRFCSCFMPSLMNKIFLDQKERRVAAEAATKTLEKIYRASPTASEIVGPFGSPISRLVGECATAKSIEELLCDGTILRLKILLQNARDGRALQTLFCLGNPVSLWAFFSLFDETEHKQEEDPQSSPKGTKLFLNLNKEVLSNWSLLDIIADFDTMDAASALLQITVEQKHKLDLPNQSFSLVNEESEIVLSFLSLVNLSNTITTRVADRAKLSNSSAALKRWGQEYGRFLRKYRLEPRNKHVSESCVVVFGTEAVKEDDGRIVENPVALKFMATREMFCNEIYQRRVVARKSNEDSKYIVPIKASFSSTSIDEFDCTKVDLATELLPYPNIRLKGYDLKYVIVMDCGAGYDLHDFISHQNIAGKDLLVVASVAKEIALCLKFLNESCGVCHGDVKARNFVARGVGLVGFSAIDLDNSSIIGQETVGKKRTSSGYLPPEQAAVVAYERFEEMDVSNSEESMDSLMLQIGAASSRNDRDEVKRLVRFYSKSSFVQKNQRRPADVVASSQYDMWCFGALLYFLCTGKQLFNVDTKEDVDDEDLMILRDWDDNWKYEKLSKVGSQWPISLLDSLLKKDPNERPKRWSFIVNELNRIGNKQENYDRLVVFQAAPLVFKDRNNEIRSLPTVDFDQESRMLCEALKDAEKLGCTIDVTFEAASLDRMNAFMAQGLSQVIHISGHGHKNYIAFEDERSGLDMVNADVLKRMVSAVDAGLLLVFISACHSQWVGEAFVEAGVPHAVCCLVNERLQDAAATEFTRNFYRALACQHSLLKAFTMAQQAVQSSPLVYNSGTEADKFLLLPHKPNDPSYHDVPVFFSSNTLPAIDESTENILTIGLPRCKTRIVGREVQQYSILNDLLTNDVIRLYGKSGLGKKSIATAVCRHIIKRSRSYPFDCIFWLPSNSEVDVKDNLYDSISSFIGILLDNGSTELMPSESRQVASAISKMSANKSIMIILDLRELKASVDATEYDVVVDELLKIQTIEPLKIILISDQIPKATLHAGREKTVPVWELDFESAITLFSDNVTSNLKRNFPTLNEPDKLISHICDPLLEIGDDEEYSKRESDVWERFFGTGIPSVCIDTARNLTEARAQELLDWWKTPTTEELQIPMDDLFL